MCVCVCEGMDGALSHSQRCVFVCVCVCVCAGIDPALSHSELCLCVLVYSERLVTVRCVCVCAAYSLCIESQSGMFCGSVCWYRLH